VRVVLLVLDSQPNRWVDAETTPHLWRLAAEGGRAEAGGEAVLSTATYPNHASFATGAMPVTHGILTNDVWDGSGFVGAETLGPRCETLFAAARAAGVSSAAVLGDQKLVGVMGAAGADSHWPPQGVLPEGTQLDEFRYAADAAVLEAIESTAALDAELVVLHLNEPDSACHLFGPDTPQARERFHATDAALGEIVERLRPRWDETVLFVVSDHDQEMMLDEPPVDVAALLAERGLPGTVASEGSAAQVVDGPGLPVLLGLPGVSDGVMIAPGQALVWGAPGTAFGAVDWRLKGSHGSPRTATQVAVVAGGHPQVGLLARNVAKLRPSAMDWAPTMAQLLGFDLAAADGRSLFESQR